MTLEHDASPAGPARRGVSIALALDLAERFAVVLLFLVFAHRMLPRLAALIEAEIAHPELILLAASINAQAMTRGAHPLTSAVWARSYRNMRFCFLCRQV